MTRSCGFFLQLKNLMPPSLIFKLLISLGRKVKTDT